ncbi:PAS domain S-box-containing protein [Silvimonas terrae]|uniref:PAS domain S-box-containing protein n=1 Tax=Silvimonas terrae TaxID=300266 RepID=A0A840RJN8_9NEIS|nr:PAS domain-containing protein [Silvimonas terrae]MBB5193327.1 PAS domain S-box-containing protein [Silvimonas terrae]
MRDGEYIVSSSDLAGRITVVNDVLIEYSGYTEAELMGRQHNILRHPDMPRALFWLIWETIKHGEDFQGYVKNLCKDGGFYWVHARISPQFDAEGHPTGYQSVRRKPARRAVDKAAVLYQHMLAAEAAVASADAVAAGLQVLQAELAAQQLAYEQWVARL